MTEDDVAIRRFVERVLKANGYVVMSAADGPAALAALESHGRPVDLLVTDVVMPGMNGYALAQEARAKNLVRKTLFLSGFSDDVLLGNGVLKSGLSLLSKPFSTEALLRKVREVLDAPESQAGL